MQIESKIRNQVSGDMTEYVVDHGRLIHKAKWSTSLQLWTGNLTRIHGAVYRQIKLDLEESNAD